MMMQEQNPVILFNFFAGTAPVIEMVLDELQVDGGTDGLRGFRWGTHNECLAMSGAIEIGNN